MEQMLCVCCVCVWCVCVYSTFYREVKKVAGAGRREEEGETVPICQPCCVVCLCVCVCSALPSWKRTFYASCTTEKYPLLYISHASPFRKRSRRHGQNFGTKTGGTGSRYGVLAGQQEGDSGQEELTAGSLLCSIKLEKKGVSSLQLTKDGWQGEADGSLSLLGGVGGGRQKDMPSPEKGKEPMHWHSLLSLSSRE